MTVGQQIWWVFYAVVYGAMLTNLTSLRPFPWGFPAESQNKGRLVWRLVFSIFCFNVAPFLVFATGFNVLESLEETMNFWQVFAISVASLSVYAPYRFYHLFMVCFKETRLSLYETKEYGEVIRSRTIRESLSGHFLAFAFYTLVFFLLFSVV